MQKIEIKSSARKEEEWMKGIVCKIVMKLKYHNTSGKNEITSHVGNRTTNEIGKPGTSILSDISRRYLKDRAVGRNFTNYLYHNIYFTFC